MGGYWLSGAAPHNVEAEASSGRMGDDVRWTQRSLPRTRRARPQVLAAAADGIIPMIDALGGDVDRIFGEVRVDIGLLNSPFNELSLAQYCRLSRRPPPDRLRQFRPPLRPRLHAAPARPARLHGHQLADHGRRLQALVDYMPAHQQKHDHGLRQERELPVPRLPDHGWPDKPPAPGRRAVPRMFCNIFYHCHGKHGRIESRCGTMIVGCTRHGAREQGFHVRAFNGRGCSK